MTQRHKQALTLGDFLFFFETIAVLPR